MQDITCTDNGNDFIQRDVSSRAFWVNVHYISENELNNMHWY